MKKNGWPRRDSILAFSALCNCFSNGERIAMITIFMIMKDVIRYNKQVQLAVTSGMFLSFITYSHSL